MQSASGRRRTAAVVTVVALVSATGCTREGSATPTTSTPRTATIPGPTASLTPEQRAADEAKQAYLTYRATLDRVFQRGGTNAREDLSKVATGDQLDFVLSQARKLEVNQWRQVGFPTVRSLVVEQVSLAAGDTATALLRLCLDASTDDALDRNGRSIRKPSALDHFIGLLTLVRRQGIWLVRHESDRQVKTC